jgi:hypothetical protein
LAVAFGVALAFFIAEGLADLGEALTFGEAEALAVGEELILGEGDGASVGATVAIGVGEGVAGEEYLPRSQTK